MRKKSGSLGSVAALVVSVFVVMLPGQALASHVCAGTSIQQLTGTNEFYCVHAATEVEAGVLGQMLDGRVPSEAEIKEMEAAFSD